MKGLKNILFNSKQDKLTEKAFMQSIAVSVISILLCVVALCSVTWAWFSEDVSSSSNTIKTGNCTVTVSVRNSETEIKPNADTSGIYSFEAGKFYEIIITSTGSAESSYCKFVISGKEYYTEQISTKDPYNTISFTLTFDTQTDVEIITRWGTYHIPNDERDFYNGKSYKNLVEDAG